MDTKLKNQNISNFLKKAEKSLMACKVLYKQKLFEDALSKAYRYRQARFSIILHNFVRF